MSAECYGEGNEAREMMREGATKEKKRVCALCCFCISQIGILILILIGILIGIGCRIGCRIGVAECGGFLSTLRPLVGCLSCSASSLLFVLASCPCFLSLLLLSIIPPFHHPGSLSALASSRMSAGNRKRFTQRNVFYLRASPYAVLETILYLDYRHIEWMNLNPHILTQVLSILRTRIMPKLRKESDSSGKLSAMSKKERVDVYSDRDFQVAYFFRRMDDRHSVLLKEKSLVFPSDPTLGEVKIEVDQDDGAGRLHAPIPRSTATPAPSAGAGPRRTEGRERMGREGESSEVPVRIKDSPEAEGRMGENASMATLSGGGNGDHGDSALFRGGTVGVGGEDVDSLAMPPPTTTRRTRSSTNEGTRRSKRVRIQEDADMKPDPSTIDVNPAASSSSSSTNTDAQPSGDEDSAINVDDDNAAIVITEEDEEKMKPKLHVKYAGFRM